MSNQWQISGTVVFALDSRRQSCRPDFPTLNVNPNEVSHGLAANRSVRKPPAICANVAILLACPSSEFRYSRSLVDNVECRTGRYFPDAKDEILDSILAVKGQMIFPDGDGEINAIAEFRAKSS